MCRQALMKWYWTTFGSTKKQLDWKKTEMGQLMSSNPNGVHNQNIARLKGEINELLLQDEIHWRQRSRVVWLESGEKNTKFFHQKATQRRRTNTITGLLDPSDTCRKIHRSLEGSLKIISLKCSQAPHSTEPRPQLRQWIRLSPPYTTRFCLAHSQQRKSRK